MLNHTEPGDFVVATGETHTVREFAEAAFREAGMELAWEKKAGVEVGVEKKTGKVRVEQDSSYYRPTEVDLLIGDASKAKKILGWSPKTKFADLVKLMVKADIEKVGKEGIEYLSRNYNVCHSRILLAGIQGRGGVEKRAESLLE